MVEGGDGDRGGMVEAVVEEPGIGRPSRVIRLLVVVLASLKTLMFVEMKLLEEH